MWTAVMLVIKHTPIICDKVLDSRNTHKKKLRFHEGTVARWHEAHETHDGTRPTEFSTLLRNLVQLEQIRKHL